MPWELVRAAVKLAGEAWAEYKVARLRREFARLEAAAARMVEDIERRKREGKWPA